MKISKKNAYELWEMMFGNETYAEDFDGGLMYKYAYGNPEYYEYRGGKKVYCGWNIHHILPKACGGTNSIDNLTCTNIITNEQAGDKVSYWIEGRFYQVQKIKGRRAYEVVRMN